MRIERLRVDGFGRLEGFDTGTAPLGPLVVVLGPNEAGKSTLFTFLTTALYGFQPASRERNPHVPWNADEAAGEIWLRLADERCARITRRLRSSPTGRLALDESTRELRNQPVPWVEHVPRTVFRQVFAITLAELAGLDEDTWARIQDRVLGAMGTTDLRPARDVADELEAEASAIWRPNRRGNQRLREVQEEVRTLRGRRLEALERDRVVRRHVEELENTRHQLREMREQRERDAIVVHRLQELLPVRRQLGRIEALRAEGGPRDPLRDLPSDPAGRLGELADGQRRQEKRLAELAEGRREPEEVLARYDEAARALQARRSEIAGLAGSMVGVAKERSEVSVLDTEVRELGIQLETAGTQLFRSGESVPEAAVAGVSLDLLGDRVDRLERARRAHDARMSTPAVAARRPRGGRAPWAPIAGLLAFGGAATVWGGFGGPDPVTLLGVALLAVGLTLTALRLVRPDEEVGQTEPAPAPPEESVESLRREIRAQLADLPVREDFVEHPGAPLVTALGRVQSLLAQRSERATRMRAMSARLDAFDREATGVAEALGLAAGRDGVATAEDLQERLTAADRAEEAARTARGELDRLERTRRAARDELNALAADEERLRAAVRDAAGPDAPDRLAEVASRLEAHARADRLVEELERAHPDLEELRARIREAETEGTSWSTTDEDLARRRARLSELTESIEEHVGRAQALEAEIQHLNERETVDSIDGEILSLQEEEKTLVVRRDRKWLMAQLVREADRRFRHEHQPDLLRRASGYLSRLTGGRYERIVVDELGQGELFELVGPGLPRPVPLARPISTGTLEQAYLSLRLAIVDHLDQGPERLPVFVDEALVNWDADRRDRGLAVLAELSESRQVFVFTCHPGLARRLEGHGARVVELDR